MSGDWSSDVCSSDLCGQLLRGPGHVDKRCWGVELQRLLRPSDTHRKPRHGCVPVPHPAKQRASRRGEKSRVPIFQPPYMLLPFSSPIDPHKLACLRSKNFGERQFEILRARSLGVVAGNSAGSFFAPRCFILGVWFLTSGHTGARRKQRAILKCLKRWDI